jgi:predicted transposase/invertase (TIGR01784 family)
MEYDYATDIEVQREEAFEKGVIEGIQQGISQGEHLKAIETAKKLLSASLGSFEQIAQVTGLSLETIKDLADNL